MSASFLAASRVRAVDVQRGRVLLPEGSAEASGLLFILQVDLLMDAVTTHLPLTTLSLLQRAAGSALLPRLRQVASERQGVTAADVEACVHVRVLRHLVLSSTLEVIKLPPSAFMLGSVADPQHVQRVRPAKPKQDEADKERCHEWRHYVPEWRRGYGPLELKRSVTLCRDTTTIGDPALEWPLLFFLDAPQTAGAVIEVGAGPIRVTLQGIEIITCVRDQSCFYSGKHFRTGYHPSIGLQTAGCRTCQNSVGRLGATCTCEPFGGPTLVVTDCRITGGFSLRGRSYFERCKFTTPSMPSNEEPRYTTPWDRLTIMEQMNNVCSGMPESFGDRTLTREPNGKLSIICTVTSRAPGSEMDEVAHEQIQNSWQVPPCGWTEEQHPFLSEGPRRRLGPHELRGPPPASVS